MRDSVCDSKADRVVTVNVSPVQYKHNEERRSTVYPWWVGVYVRV